MRRTVPILLIVLAAVALLSSTCFGLQAVEKSDGKYDFDWSGCTLDQILADLHSQYSVQSMAMIRPLSNKNGTSVRDIKPSDLPRWIASGSGLDWWSIRPGFNLFSAYSTQTLRLVETVASSVVVAEMTPDLLKRHHANNGLLIKELSPSQLPWGRYLASL